MDFNPQSVIMINPTGDRQNSEQGLVETIFANDSFENQARQASGKFPIVFRGTRKDKVKEDITGTFGEIYFGYDAGQARSFAEVNGKYNGSAVIRVDLQELSQVEGIDIKFRDNDVVIKGKIPREYIDVFEVS